MLTDLKKRLLTAAILIPLVVISIFYTSPIIFRLILAIVLMLAAWEWSSLIPLKKTHWQIGYLLLIAAAFYLSTFVPQNILILFGTLVWLYVSYYIATNFLSFNSAVTPNPALIAGEESPSTRRSTSKIKSIFISVAGIFVLTVCWVSLSFLRNQSPKWVIILLLIVWLADTAAYFTGRRFGRHFLAPHISPKKTWEGAFGAFLAVFAMMLTGGWLMGLKMNSLVYLTLLALATTFISILGDLFESLLKRQAGTKDSGQLLPGHGGLLDRIDSLIAAAPFFAGGILLMTN